MSFSPLHRERIPFRPLLGSLVVGSLATVLMPLGLASAAPAEQGPALTMGAQGSARVEAQHASKKRGAVHKKRRGKHRGRVHRPTPKPTRPSKPAAPASSSTPTTTRTTTTTHPATGSAVATPFRTVAGFLGAGSEWLRDVSAAPTAPDSDGIAADIAQQVATRWGGVAAFNWDQYNNSFYTVAANAPRTSLLWDNCQNKPSVPPALFGTGGAFVDVPVPDNAVPATGSDGALSLFDPSTDQLWEFWKAVKRTDGWHACWGGRIDHWSQSPGSYDNGLGVSASGLAVSPAMVGIQEMQQRHIDHAIGLGLPDVASWQTVSYPANRSDGNLPVGTPNAVAEGQRLRLDPSLDVESLDLTPIAKAVAVAAQKYGFIVMDRSGAVGIAAESGNGVAATTGTDPWTSLMAGVPGYLIMRDFPWDRLQALPMNYGRP